MRSGYGIGSARLIEAWINLPTCSDTDHTHLSSQSFGTGPCSPRPITRDVETVVLVGGLVHINEIIASVPKSSERKTAMDFASVVGEGLKWQYHQKGDRRSRCHSMSGRAVREPDENYVYAIAL